MKSSKKRWVSVRSPEELLLDDKYGVSRVDESGVEQVSNAAVGPSEMPELKLHATTEEQPATGEKAEKGEETPKKTEDAEDGGAKKDVQMGDDASPKKDVEMVDAASSKKEEDGVDKMDTTS